jgi:2-methylcitrate dehydratase
MLAVALGYTVQSRFVDHANFMSGGFDHTAQLAFSHNAAAGRLLGLSEQQLGHAMAMAAVSDASFAVVRAKPLSQWKGLASSQSALGAMSLRCRRSFPQPRMRFSRRPASAFGPCR